MHDDEFELAMIEVDEVVAAYRDAGMRDVSVFEHGCRTGHPPTGCIDHAHWHVVPVHFALPHRLEWTQINDFRDLRRAAPSGGYLFLKNGEGSFVSHRVPGRQYLRQHLAAQLGRPGEWDYVVFPHLDNILATVDLFRASRPC